MQKYAVSCMPLSINQFIKIQKICLLKKNTLRMKQP